MLFSTFIVLAALIYKPCSAVIVNNVSMPSDILSQLFFSEIRKNRDVFGISDAELIANNSCFLALEDIANQLPNGDVLPFIDAWGSLPSGILKGHFFNVGNFDECIEISVTLSTPTGLVNGQYCVASLPLDQSMLEMNSMMQTRDLGDVNILESMFAINIGICVPDSCSQEDINQVFQSFGSVVFDGALSKLNAHSCTNGKIPEYRAIDIVFIAVFGLVAGLMIISSVFELLMTSLGKSPAPVLLAFSIISNGKKLFAINNERSPNMIGCLMGIRVISMIWIFYSHSYKYTFLTPMINTLDAYHLRKQARMMHVINASVSVDSFFFISGLLVAWHGFKTLDTTNGKLNIVMMYIHRYIRLTPILCAIILIDFSLGKLVVTGPFRQLFSNLETCNEKNWWPLLLYLHNYIVHKPGCAAYSWYLAVDFQLYILSPLLLIPMWKWKRKFSPVLIIVSLLSIGCVMATYFMEGYTDLAGFLNDEEWEKTYTPTHTRCSPWIVGFGLGYFMHVNRGKTFRLHWLVNLSGWIFSFALLSSIIFGPSNTITTNFFGTVVEAVMYESLKRVSWAIALAWITFACHFGFGGVVDLILSHPNWQPLGRMTYAMYLIHIPLIRVVLGSMRTEKYFSEFREILSFWSVFGISMGLSTALTLAFESPTIVLEKAIFGREKQEKKPSENIDTTVPARIST